MKTLTGKVVSLKMKNTIVVKVERQLVHPLYKKIMRRTRQFKADYQGNSMKEGDQVELIETRPMSKDKHYKVIDTKEKS